MEDLWIYGLLSIPIIKIILEIIGTILSIIFSVRVWVIVRYHYYKIKDKERAEKIKREYHELIQEERQKTETIKEPDIIEEPEIVEEEPEIIEELKEPKTLKEKINRFLFRE